MYPRTRMNRTKASNGRSMSPINLKPHHTYLHHYHRTACAGPVILKRLAACWLLAVICSFCVVVVVLLTLSSTSIRSVILRFFRSAASRVLLTAHVLYINHHHLFAASKYFERFTCYCRLFQLILVASMFFRQLRLKFFFWFV